MSFETPWLLLLLPPLLAGFWWVARRGYAPISPRSQRAAFALRSVIALLLIAALTGPVWEHETRRRHLFLVLDVSQSISGDNLAAALADVDRLVESTREQDDRTRFTVILFGRRPRIIASGASDPRAQLKAFRSRIRYRDEIPRLRAEIAKRETTGNSDAGKLKSLQRELRDAEEFRDTVAGDRTDAESAVRLALNADSADAAPDVYLFTDAQFNRGDWRRAWSDADAAGTPIHLVSLDRVGGAEAAVARIAVPSSARIHQSFTARVRLSSNRKGQGVLTLFQDGFRVAETKVELAPGERDVEIGPLHFEKKGFHDVEARLSTQTDTQLENNVCRAIVNVPGPIRVLYVDGNETQTQYLKSALETEGVDVEVRPAGGVPRRLEDLLGFDAFVLCNVPADKLSLPQMQLIKTYVAEFGGGFAMLGGEESFGLGGYYKTPLEEILPVRMPIRKNLVRPSLALFLVIDKSGSMDGAKIQLAKRAAIATAEVVDRRDRIGVIGFDGASKVILELTPASDRQTITSRIASLNADGGTNLYPALRDARARLRASTARRKHVIVLSDGQTQGEGYEQLARAMAGEGVSISTVGIGRGADLNLLRKIANAAGGRTYFTNDFRQIPQIFTREALRATKGMLVEKLTQPKLSESDVALKGIDTSDLPLLLGYVATTPKAKARTILVSERGDPLLSRWRFGLGRTAAFTSEPKPRWAEDWTEWPDFARFWSQLARSLANQSQHDQLGIALRHTLADDSVIVTADMQTPGGDFADDVALQATLIRTAGNRLQRKPVKVRHTGPGRFEAVVPLAGFGEPQRMMWTARLKPASAQPPKDAPQSQVPYGFVYPVSPEFQTLGPNRAAIAEIASRRQGDTFSVGKTQLVDRAQPASRRTVLWPYLLAVALLLAPVDILIRRLG